MARAGAEIILDMVFLNGAVAQERWRIVLAGLQVLWVAVKCDPLAAAAREAARGDRVPGMATLQAHLVHQGVDYDMEVEFHGDLAGGLRAAHRGYRCFNAGLIQFRNNVEALCDASPTEALESRIRTKVPANSRTIAAAA